MRISDWSSDVCSSDLTTPLACVFNAKGAFGLAGFNPVINRCKNNRFFSGTIRVQFTTTGNDQGGCIGSVCIFCLNNGTCLNGQGYTFANYHAAVQYIYIFGRPGFVPGQFTFFPKLTAGLRLIACGY